MRYKNAVAFPRPELPSKDWSQIERLTVPDQSLTLADIIDRFSRKEALPIGKQVSFNDEIEVDSPFAVDLEKLAKADIIDKMEYVEQWKTVTTAYAEQDKKAKAAKDAADKKATKIADEQRIEKEVQARMAKQSSEKSAV